MISPVIEQLAMENFGKIVFGKINVDENPKTASEYEVMSIPTLIIFKDAKKVGEIKGALSKTDMERQINNIISGGK